MTSLVVVTRAALLIVRHGPSWTVEEHLRGRGAECVAIDPADPSRMYCGTTGAGLFRSRDGGSSWASAGPGITHATITAVAVGAAEQPGGPGVVYAGTEPSAVFRSGSGGESWTDLDGLRALPSASTWSFPPRPHTHHVRWIEVDPAAAGRVFVAIERAPSSARSMEDGRGTIACAAVPTTRTGR